VFDYTKFPEFDNHEMVVFLSDEKTGLKGFIAIHNTNLGPATGGTRYWNYSSEEEALRDALRLAKDMTYKCALARVPYGGGKAVIIGNPTKPKTKELIQAYAKRINLLGGNFTTGQDAGISPGDLKIMGEVSPFVNGQSAGELGWWCALGVFSAIKTTLNEVFGSANVKGKTFAVKGLGKTGLSLCLLIAKAGGEIIATDINTTSIRRAKKKIKKIRFVRPAEIHKQKVDVFCPCALGKDLTTATIPQLRCQIVCGSANSQLGSIKAGELVYRKKIVYVPDYAANAGGLIQVAEEMDKRGYDRRRAVKKVLSIGKTVEKILEYSKKMRKPTNVVADEMVEKKFKK